VHSNFEKEELVFVIVWKMWLHHDFYFSGSSFGVGAATFSFQEKLFRGACFSLTLCGYKYQTLRLIFGRWLCREEPMMWREMMMMMMMKRGL
jgi:hypothetical protein